MAAFSGLAPVRDDFRCSLCQRKNTFHCEHDTPYRDQLLGTYDQERPNLTPTKSRRGSHRLGSHNNNYNSTNNNNNRMQNTNIGQNTNINTGRNRQSNASGQYQQGRISDNNSLSNTNPNGSIKINEQKKKNKSCVIL